MATTSKSRRTYALTIGHFPAGAIDATDSAVMI
jgi:hypothetical protein